MCRFEWEEFGRCSLLAFNNSSFKEEDKVNILKIGRSDKKNDPFSVGRFGLGFNTVYHITDVPSLCSNGSIIIFDPLEYKSTATNPGFRIDANNHTEAFQGYVGCYKSNLFPSFKEEEGTIFRLPLRLEIDTTRENISDKPKTFTCDELLNVIKLDLLKLSKKMLLFLTNLKRVIFSHIPLGCSQKNILYTVPIYFTPPFITLILPC